MDERIIKETGKLGFGLMRLPHKGLGIDIEQTSGMVDLFMEAGGTYFDTAHVYPGSEAAAKKALVERHSRDSFTLATKLNASMLAVSATEKMAKKQFETSLERTGAGYFDYYLLHALDGKNYKRYEKFGIWDFVKEKKALGLIRHVGFSFHGTPEILEKILTEHPEAEFVQLQINYADWENSSVLSRANYEVARRFGKPIVVMEPVKGGKLADPPEEVKKLFREYAPDRSYASWAIRFVASLDGILTVLSGMSTIGQMKDNLSYMRQFEPFNEEEWKIIGKAMKIMGEVSDIPCTACSYCTEGCPQQIMIPDIFKAVNLQLGRGRLDEAKAAYEAAAPQGRRASDCIECGQCESVCPQGIPVIKELKRAAEMFEG